jgi:hypothetical protein
MISPPSQAGGFSASLGNVSRGILFPRIEEMSQAKTFRAKNPRSLGPARGAE